MYQNKKIKKKKEKKLTILSRIPMYSCDNIFRVVESIGFESNVYVLCDIYKKRFEVCLNI